MALPTGETQNYDLKDMKDDILYTKKHVSQLNKILRGDSESDAPSGLIYQVSENARFRRFAIKVLWLLVANVVGLITHQVINILTS